MAAPFRPTDRAAIARFAAALPRAQLHFPDVDPRGCSHAFLRTGRREFKIVERGALLVLIDLANGAVLGTAATAGELLKAA